MLLLKSCYVQFSNWTMNGWVCFAHEKFGFTKLENTVKHLKWSITAKIPYERNFRTAKIPYGEKSWQRKLRTAKIPYRKKSIRLKILRRKFVKRKFLRRKFRPLCGCICVALHWSKTHEVWYRIGLFLTEFQYHCWTGLNLPELPKNVFYWIMHSHVALSNNAISPKILSFFFSILPGPAWPRGSLRRYTLVSSYETNFNFWHKCHIKYWDKKPWLF